MPDQYKIRVTQTLSNVEGEEPFTETVEVEKCLFCWSGLSFRNWVANGLAACCFGLYVTAAALADWDGRGLILFFAPMAVTIILMISYGLSEAHRDRAFPWQK